MRTKLLIRSALAFLSLMVTVLPAGAAPTRFNSSSYGLESLIFGGTGTLRSSASSIPPVITTGPVVTAITTTGATVSWETDKASNTVEAFGTQAGQYSRQAGVLTDATVTAHKVELDGLVKGTAYYYVVQSSDVSGNIVQSAESSFSTDPGDVTAPTITGGPNLAYTSASSAVVTWETNELASSQVEYGVGSVSENTLGSAEELTLFHQVQLNGLRSNQTYIYRVRSRDGSDNVVLGAVLSTTTPLAPAVTNVTISDITLNSALVQWQTTNPSSSRVSYGTEVGVYPNQVDEATLSTTHTIRLSGLSSGTTYSLLLSGQDGAGNAFTSDVYQFKTVVLPVITDFKVSELTSNSALFTWESSSDIDELLRYTVVKSDQEGVVGKSLTSGNEGLVKQHAVRLSDLESGSSYTASVLGKDVFGNVALSISLVFDTLPDNEPPQILNLKSDTTVDLGGKNVNVLVAFGLSERAAAIIEYGPKSSEAYTKTVETDTELSNSKLLVIPGLTPGDSYHFRVVATDRRGNRTESPDYLVLAPIQPVSLFDLIFGQIRSNFGWLQRL